MRILCIDTSAGSAVALCDDVQVLARAASPDERRHAESLAPLLAAVLAEAGCTPRDLGALAVGTGPAPFTGLRVGLVTARAMARALGVPALGAPSLDVLARQALDVEPGRDVVVATDARRREVYSARYRARGDDDVERVGDLDVGPAQHLAERLAGEDVVVAGRGTELYPEHLPATAGLPVAVDPAVLARLVLARRAGGASELGTDPHYLRRPDVTMAAGRKRAS